MSQAPSNSSVRQQQPVGTETIASYGTPIPLQTRLPEKLRIIFEDIGKKGACGKSDQFSL